MDTTTQIVLLIMITVLGATLVVIGIMLFFVLKDMRESIGKVNLILDDVEKVSDKLANGSELVEDSLVSIHEAIVMIKQQVASPLSSIMGLISMFGNRRQKGGE